MSRPSARLGRLAPVTGALAVGALLLTACGGGSGFDDATADATGGSDGTGGAAGGSLDILIGSSGDAETAAVKEAVAAWSAESGVSAEVRVAADLAQELAQGFAASTPPDLFYVSTDQFAGYAANGSITPYLDQLANKDDFYPTLVDSFTYDGTPYCAPKDFSTLALVINTDMWAAAGLTDADIPTTWDQLASVATTLAPQAQAGLSFGPEWQRVGVFMAQAGGALVEDGAAVVDSDANVQALTYVKDLLSSGSVAFPADIGAGWGGEAFGSGAAAMTIEGNWIVGAMTNDFPDVPYTVVELPEGPAGTGTLQFTNCWGVASDSANQDAAVQLVEYLTSDEQQMAFAKAFGVMPSVSTVAQEWQAEFPEQAAFLAGADYAQGVPAIEGVSDVIADFNSQIETLKTGDPATILTSVQGNLTAILP